MPPKVTIVIPNFNGEKLLPRCLDSLHKLNYQNFEIIIVDNNSTDNSKELISNNYPRVKIISLNYNSGFGTANNIAFEAAFKDPKVKYVAALNNDTEVDVNWLSGLVELAEQNPQIGSVASKMLFYYEPHLINAVGVLISYDGGGINEGYKQEDKGQFETAQEIFGASGGSALYSRAMLEKINLGGREYFDDDYFLYYEDVDLCWRARLAGFSCYYAPKSIVRHVHSATAISHSPLKAYHIQRNRLFNIIKDFPFWTALYALFIIIPIRYLHLLNSAFIKKAGPSQKLKEKTSAGMLFKLTIKAWLDFFKFLPRMLKKRRLIQKNKCVKNQQIKFWFKQYPADIETMIYK